MLTGQAADVHLENQDLSNIPKDYWQFADVFCKQKAKSLPSHRPSDLAIQIEEGANPPLGPIYSLTPLVVHQYYLSRRRTVPYNYVLITKA